MVTNDPAAFDSFAEGYDDEFTHSALGRLLRQRVWEVLGRSFPAGSHVLEIACGTGEDAVWLAQRGVQVSARDGSSAMVRTATTKAAQADVSGLVSVQQETLQELCQRPVEGIEPQFDGAFSNFGGLNTICEWQQLGQRLARYLRPDARVVLVPMGPLCPWEIGWYALHGQLANALRRLRQPAVAQIGGSSIPIWYPRPGRLHRCLEPWFRAVHTESLGLWLPPSYLGHLVDRFPTFFRQLHRLEKATAARSGGWGDHYVTVLVRR